MRRNELVLIVTILTALLMMGGGCSIPTPADYLFTRQCRFSKTLDDITGKHSLSPEDQSVVMI